MFRRLSRCFVSGRPRQRGGSRLLSTSEGMMLAAASVLGGISYVLTDDDEDRAVAGNQEAMVSTPARLLAAGCAVISPSRCEGSQAAASAVATSVAAADLGYLTTVPIQTSTVAATKDDDVEARVGSSSPSSSFRLIDTYEISEVLGEGAYGLVYKAQRKKDGRIVALKSMSRDLTGKTDFEREVAALRLLSKPPNGPHEHIVQLYDLHRDDENYYLAMELIEGGELLEHLIDNGPYSEGLAAKFLRQFAEAITHVHSSGLAHADLKPENLLLSSNTDLDQAKLKLCDFGCAQRHDLSRKELHLPYEEFAKGCSFLHMAALGNQFELEKMLQERPNLVEFRDYDFRTGLHLASSEGHVDICRFLVEKGAKINRSDRWGGSPLDDAYRHKHADVIQYLREQGATFGTSTQLPRFIQAASEGDANEVKALLEFGDVKIDEGDYDGRRALHLAAGEGHAEVVRLLCDAGADPNVEDRWGNRPLDDAATSATKQNSKQVMKILIEYGGTSLKDPSLCQQTFEEDENASRASSSSSSASIKRRRQKGAEVVSGTISYWPPELFEDGALPTPASDMWAVGAIMFVLLTGT